MKSSKPICFPRAARFLAGCTFAALTATAGAAPIILTDIPSDAKWMVHLDMDAMHESQSGQRIQSEIEHQHGDQIKAIARVTSVNPLTDISGLTIFGDQIGSNRSVVLIYGKSDRAHIADVVGGADGHLQDAKHGFQTHQWNEGDKARSLAFVRDDLMVFSESGLLWNRALESIAGEIPRNADEFFTASDETPLVVAFGNMDSLEFPADLARMLQRAKSIRIAVTERGSALETRLKVEAADVATADKIMRLMDGVLAFAELDPSLAGKLEIESEFQLTEGSPGFTATASLPLADAEQWLLGKGVFINRED